MTTATDTGFMEMRLGKVVGVTTEQDDPCCFLVLDGVSKDRHLPIQIGRTEAFNLSATLTGLDFPRPMSPLFAAGPSAWDPPLRSVCAAGQPARTQLGRCVGLSGSDQKFPALTGRSGT